MNSRYDYVNASQILHQTFLGAVKVDRNNLHPQACKLPCGSRVERRGAYEACDLLDVTLVGFLWPQFRYGVRTNLVLDLSSPSTMDEPVRPVAPTIATFMIWCPLDVLGS